MSIIGAIRKAILSFILSPWEQDWMPLTQMPWCTVMSILIYD
jgi:hypothetical protein